MSTDCWGINGLTDSPEDEARDSALDVLDMPSFYDPAADAYWAARDRWYGADPGPVDEVILL